MDFSLFNINNIAEKNIWDYVINIAGMIIIPLTIYLLSSVYGEQKKDRENKIQALNSLTLYCKNLLQEILKLRNNEKRRKDALQNYMKNPAPEHFTKAFYIVRTPSLQYELYANDFAFTTKNQYFALVDLIYEINSNLKIVTTHITEFNMHSEMALRCDDENRSKMAQEMLLNLDDFHHKCNILAYLVNQLIRAIKIYNSYYFFQDIMNIEFKGVMKELLEKVDAEIDIIYNPKDCEWRNAFTENVENPPVAPKYRDFLKVIYLKFCGYIDKQKRLLKKKIYTLKKTEQNLSLRTVKSDCSDEKINEINSQYKQIIDKYELYKEKFNSLELVDNDLNLKLHKGLSLRLNRLITSTNTIFQILPPERNVLLTSEEISQVEINLNFFTTNYIPCLNGIFKFLYSFCYPNESNEDINFVSPKLNDIIDENYQNKLHKFCDSELYKLIESYDYSISNELPFELASALIGNDNQYYVGIKIIPDEKAKADGIKEFFIYDYIIKTLNLLLEVANDVYETILKNSQIPKNDEHKKIK